MLLINSDIIKLIFLFSYFLYNFKYFSIANICKLILKIVMLHPRNTPIHTEHTQMPQENMTDLRINIKFPQLMSTMVDFLLELTFCIFCWITYSSLNIHQMKTSIGNTFLTFNIFTTVIFFCTGLRVKKDIHFYDKTLIPNHTYSNYLLIDNHKYDIVKIIYIIRMCISLVFSYTFFKSCHVFSGFICNTFKIAGIFPFVIFIQSFIILGCTNKYTYLSSQTINSTSIGSTQNNILKENIAKYLQKIGVKNVTNEERQKYSCIECTICLSEITDSDKVIQLECFHMYHPNCIEKWLDSKNTCPMCKQDILKSINCFEIENKENNV